MAVDSKFWNIPFATSGDKATIPDATQPSGAISLTQGFGPDYERDPATDPLAKRIPRDETNEYLYQITNALKYIQWYGTPQYTAVADGGPANYPLTARVRYDAGAGMQAWRSLVATNTAVPGSDATKWALDEAFSFTALEATLAEALAGAIGTKVITPRRLASAVQQGDWNYFVAAGTANAITASLSPAPAAIGDITGSELVMKVTTTNTLPVTLNLNGLGAFPIQRLDGTPLGNGDLQGGSYVVLIPTGSAYRLVSLAYQEVRRRLSANTSFFVNGATGSDANDGLSAGTAWATLTKASNYLTTQLDLGGFVATINVAAATYTAGFALAGYIPGQIGGGSILLVGVNAAPATCFINVATGPAISATSGAAFTASGFQVAGPQAVSGAGLYAATGGQIVFGNINFNAAGAAQLYAELGGFLRANNGYTINGNAPSHFKASDGGVISVPGFNVQVVGGPTFPTAFAYAYTGVINAPSSLFSGAATGPRYYADMNGAIKTGGLGPNFFPGSIAGAVNQGGQYQ